MATQMKRLTFAITPDVQTVLDSAKKELFYNRSRSEMIRELVKAGFRSLETDEDAQEQKCRTKCTV